MTRPALAFCSQSRDALSWKNALAKCSNNQLTAAFGRFCSLIAGPRPLARLTPSGPPRRSMSASTVRPVRHSIPLPFSIVERPHAAGLVGGEGFAVDASLIQADANKQRSIAGRDWRRARDPARSSRAVKEYLDLRTAGGRVRFQLIDFMFISGFWVRYRTKQRFGNTLRDSAENPKIVH